MENLNDSDSSWQNCRNKLAELKSYRVNPVLAQDYIEKSKKKKEDVKSVFFINSDFYSNSRNNFLNVINEGKVQGVKLNPEIIENIDSAMAKFFLLKFNDKESFSKHVALFKDKFEKLKPDICIEEEIIDKSRFVDFKKSVFIPNLEEFVDKLLLDCANDEFKNLKIFLMI